MSGFVKPKDLTEDSTVQEVAKAAYYQARLSDSTRHGTDSAGAQRVIVNWSKAHARSPADAYERIHNLYEKILDEQTA